MDQECEIFRVLFYLYMNIYGDFQIYISVPLIFDNNYIWDNSVYTEIKVDVTKQIDSAYFRIILTQDWTVNSFQGVQRKQTFIWSIGIETFEALETMETQLYFTWSAIAKKTYWVLKALFELEPNKDGLKYSKYYVYVF